MNQPLLNDIRAWKPTRAASQVDLADVLGREWRVYASLGGYWASAPRGVRLHSSWRLVYSVDTLEELGQIQDLLCFETKGDRRRFYWVRNTGLHAIGLGPQFSIGHFQWITSHIHRCWRRYVDPKRRRSSTNDSTTTSGSATADST